MKVFHIFFLLFITNVSVAQYDIDSLWNVWEDKTQPDSNRVKAINNYSWYGYLFTQPDSAFYFAQIAYDFEKSINDEKSMVQSSYIQGISYYLRGEFENAIERYTEALTISTRIGFNKGAAQAQNGMGVVYQKSGNYTKSLENYESSLKNYKKINDLAGTASVLGNMGIIHKIQGNYVKAIEYYNDGLKLHAESGDKQGVSSTLNNLGIIYYEQKDYEKAIEHYEGSLKLDRETDNVHGEALTLNNMGTLYLEIKDYENALSYFNDALMIEKKIDDKLGVSASMFNIANVYQNQKNYSKAMSIYKDCLKLRNEIGDKKGKAETLISIGEIYYHKKKYTAAKQSNFEALTIAQDVGSANDIKNAAFNLYETLKSLNDNSNALEMYELYITMKDSIDSEENQKEIFRHEFKITYEKQAAADSVKTAEEKKVTDAQIAFSNAQLEKEQTQRYSLYGGLILLIIFGGFTYNRFRVSQKQKDLIEKQKSIVDQAFNTLEEKNTEIMDSIKYAKRIQTAILPPDKLVQKAFKNSFVLYKPKDIVAGDFYWLEHKHNLILFAAADCTGHGVPGAMVSVICNNGLNRSVREHGLTDPGEILDKTREIVIGEFEKSDEEVKDGMDIALCTLQNNTLQYSGAHNPLWIIRDNELIEIKADKQPIGKYLNQQAYQTHTVELLKNDTIYIFSDGYADQFGGENNKKFKTKNFKKLLLSIQNHDMSKQKQLLEEAFNNWRGDLEQLDDVCILGVRV
jgi:serine phosphatase RsbU (regulator of sigma subunit)/Tfp pilus assembly protein PilF